ncbi:hypothetical protein ACIBHX_41405 [Nonomuraea sp. NPDC050536]|uniref:hypothetical protein n=1 Tax=Nonomuraea sp. NPDC050536 TaxID=3364366 RepID=UPI0037C74B9C
MSAQQAMAEFAATGGIGPLRCGASLTDLVAELGRPWDIGRVTKHRRWPHLFSYGDVELCVCHCRTVTMISVQSWRDPIELPDSHSNMITPMRSSVTYEQITSALDAAACRWHPIPGQPSGQTALYTEPHGVNFVFRISESGALLEKAGTWISSHDCLPPPSGLPDDGLGL